LLPEVHEETVELLRRLIEYDPRSRISAEQAIALPVFRELRGIDEEWRQTAQILPFPLFVSTGGGPVQQRIERGPELQPLPPLSPTPAATVNAGSLQDSRAKAAQRIREYKMKRLGNPAGKAKFVCKMRFQ
jgi:serine/threonine protein kinase